MMASRIILAASRSEPRAATNSQARVKHGKPDPKQIAPIAARYGLELDPSSIPSLKSRFGVTF